MEKILNATNWFELPVNDFERAKHFYETLFSFQMPELMVGDTLMGFLPYDFKKDGVGGAICQGEGYTPSSEGALVYLNGGEDLQDVLDKVKPAGGKIIKGKAFITPEIGYVAIFLDTEGNRVALQSHK